MSKLSIVIPAFNEQDNIAPLVNEVIEAFRTNDHFFIEIILVNDGSTDSTLDVMKRLATNNTNVKVMQHQSRRGLGAALWTGFSSIEEGLCSWLPSDGQIAVKSIHQMLREYKDVDVVLLNRQSNNRGLVRSLLSVCMSTWARFNLKIELNSYCGIFLCNVNLISQIKLVTESFAQTLLVPAVIEKFNVSCSAITTTVLPRASGRSKVANFNTLLKVFIDIIKLRRYLNSMSPIKLSQ